MIAFEKQLIDNGYIKLGVDHKNGGLYVATSHVISTMVNLGYLYIHKDDIDMEKVVKGGYKTCLSNKKIITVALCDKGKPPTVVRPRVLIEFRKGDEVVYSGCRSAIEYLIANFEFDEVIRTLFDKDNIKAISLDGTKVDINQFRSIY